MVFLDMIRDQAETEAGSVCVCVSACTTVLFMNEPSDGRVVVGIEKTRNYKYMGYVLM